MVANLKGSDIHQDVAIRFVAACKSVSVSIPVIAMSTAMAPIRMPASIARSCSSFRRVPALMVVRSQIVLGRYVAIRNTNMMPHRRHLSGSGIHGNIIGLSRHEE